MEQEEERSEEWKAEGRLNMCCAFPMLGLHSQRAFLEWVMFHVREKYSGNQQSREKEQAVQAEEQTI